MRILVVGGYAPSLIAFRGHLLARMVELGHTVVAAATDGTDRIRSQLGAIGVEYHELPLHRTGMNPIADARFFLELRRLIRKTSPDLFLGYTVKPVIYGCLAAQLARVPRSYAMITGLGYALLSQETTPRRALRALVSRMYRVALGGSSAVILQNPDDLDYFRTNRIIDHDKPAFVTHGSGVDLDHFRPAPPIEDSLVFLLIGQLHEDKGVVQFVEAARLIRESHPHVRFQLLGSLDRKPATISRDQLAAWLRSGVVEYLGRVDDVRPVLAQASVFVLPSYREGTSRAALEALAMGRPIIATDVPGNREVVVDGENGFLVPVRDASGLRAAMNHFIDDPTLVAPMGRRSRRLAEEKYDVHFVNEDILRVLGLESAPREQSRSGHRAETRSPPTETADR